MRFLLFLLLIHPFSWGQQTDIVDFIRVQGVIEPNFSEKMVTGTLNYRFKMLSDSDSVYLEAVNMTATTGPSSGYRVRATADKIVLYGDYKTGEEYWVSFGYTAKPSQTLYFTGDQTWTQGQGKYTSHWLPSIDDMNDKIEFDLEYLVDPSIAVIANGHLERITEFEGNKLWSYSMNEPMSSYLVAVVMGNFDKNTLQSDSGIPIELYFRPQDSSKAEPTYRYTKAMFDFLETEIGVPYPWQNYKQVPVRDFLYAGMENTTTTVFSEAFVVDSIGFVDRNYVNVNAHELAHQWFGNLVTETESTHHWLHEGFATYYALLAERELFGEDYYYWKLYNSAEQLQALSEQGKGESLMNPKASSLTFYEKGAWALHILRERIGDDAFRKAVQTYLAANAYGNVTTDDFLEALAQHTLVDISDWKKDWLQQTAFQINQASKSLGNSPFMQKYFQVQNLRKMPINEKVGFILDTPELFENEYLGQEVIHQMTGEPLANTFSVYKKAFETGHLLVRQQIALTLSDIPLTLKANYESLLDDPSYVTKEAALYNLWIAFPEDRIRYLDGTKDVIGFQDKNVRQLWLALALSTPGYMSSAQSIMRKELSGYSSNEYSFEIRQRALEYLFALGLLDETVLNNLVDAAVHPNWRFRKYARTLLDETLKDPTIKATLQNKLTSYSEAEQNYLRKVLE